MGIQGTFKEGFRWEGSDLLKYKEEGSHFKTITRQILFDGREDFPMQMRYFEIAPGGHSTLERHEHVHVVMVIRGEGEALVGRRVHQLKRFDVVVIEPETWHQFRATRNTEFGFLCMVKMERDRPHLPDEQEKKKLLENPEIAHFVRL